MEIAREVIEKIKTLNRPAVIGVSGFGGSGKSTFADALGTQLGVPVIGLDSFARSRLSFGT
ncbi:MAG TPA: uridine kinase, partial [Candidatus Paceibacterota bacterium]|nr:uridine kinase [Candidatus Paceibacterota bacterium]